MRYYVGYFMGRWVALRPDLIGEPACSLAEFYMFAHQKGWAV